MPDLLQHLEGREHELEGFLVPAIALPQGRGPEQREGGPQLARQIPQDEMRRHCALTIV
jgi:hypothetical protein